MWQFALGRSQVEQFAMVEWSLAGIRVGRLDRQLDHCSVLLEGRRSLAGDLDWSWYHCPNSTSRRFQVHLRSGRCRPPLWILGWGLDWLQ